MRGSNRIIRMWWKKNYFNNEISFVFVLITGYVCPRKKVTRTKVNYERNEQMNGQKLGEKEPKRAYVHCKNVYVTTTNLANAWFIAFSIWLRDVYEIRKSLFCQLSLFKFGLCLIKNQTYFFSPMYIIYWVFVFSVFSWPPSLSTFDMNSWNCIIRWMCFLTARQWNATQMNITIFKTHSPFFCCLCFFRKIRWWWKKNERNNNTTHKHLHTSFTFCVAHVSGEFNMPKTADKRTKPKTTRAHTHIHKP